MDNVGKRIFCNGQHHVTLQGVQDEGVEIGAILLTETVKRETLQ